MSMGNISHCRGCGEPIEKKNNDMWLLRYASDSPQALLADYAYHILPVVGDDGEVLCPGNPRVAQYLPDQPRESGPDAYYEESLTEFFRNGYNKLQEICSS